MNKHWNYFKYVMRHKYWVFRGGMKYDVGLWQLIVHDLSKFRPSEWTPYVEWFYNKANNPMALEHQKDSFQVALNRHFNRNPHHWEHWLLYRGKLGEWVPQNAAGVGVVPQHMPEKYVREMLADWYGASMAQRGEDGVKDWWEKMGPDIILHPTSRALVEALIYGYDVDTTYESAS